MPDLASEYLEKTLPWHRRIAVRWHLSICDACTAYYRQIRQTIALLGNLQSPPPPEAEERALAAIENRPRPSPAE